MPAVNRFAVLIDRGQRIGNADAVEFDNYSRPSWRIEIRFRLVAYTDLDADARR